MMNQIPVPPLDMVMPQAANSAYNIVTYVILAIVALLLLRESQRRGSLLPIFCLLGGAVAFLLEPAFDIVACVWYPAVNHEPIYRAFNYSIPYWMLPAYALYMGAQGYWMLRQFESGISASRLWTLFFLFWGSNAIVEMPGLNLGIYTYYGDQPFRLFGFPLWMAMTNSVVPIIIGAVLYRLQGVLAGARTIFVVPLLPMLVAAVEAGEGWPVWIALNSGAGYAATYAGALVTLALSLMSVHLVGLVCCAGPQAARDAMPRAFASRAA